MISIALNQAMTTQEQLQTSELALISRAQKGDRRAMQQVIRGVAHDVAKMARYLCGPIEGPDLAQASLEKILRKLGHFSPGRGTFRNWALTVTRRECIDRIRKRGVEAKAFDKGNSDAESAYKKTPEYELERQATRKHIQNALAELPDETRQAIILFHIEGLKYEEIATAMKIPLGTVMTRIHRGRKTLRKSLEFTR